MQSTNDPRLLIGLGAVKEGGPRDRSLAVGRGQFAGALDAQEDLRGRRAAVTRDV